MSDTGKAGEQAMGAFASMGRSLAEQQQKAMSEFTKMFSQVPGMPSMPGLPDMRGLMEAHRRNMEVLSAANRVAMEGAQTVARRHMEIMQQSMSELSETMRALAAPEAPQAKAAKQAEMLKVSFERAVTNMRELADLMQRSNGEAVGLLNTRFVEAVDEAKGFLEKAQGQIKQG